MTDYVLSTELRGNASGLTAAINDGVASFDKLDKSAQKASGTVDQLDSKMASRLDTWKKMSAGVGQHTEAVSALDDELTQFMSRLDPAYKKVLQLDTGHDLLTRGVQAGLITQKQYDDALVKMTTRFGPVAEGTKLVAEATDRGRMMTSQATRELIVLGREAMTGNVSRMPGSFMVLASRIGLSGTALTGIIVPLAAVGAGLAVIGIGAVHAETLARALADVEMRFAATGRGGQLAGVQVKALIEDIALMPGISKTSAEATVEAIASIPRLSAAMFENTTRLAADFAAVTGQKAPEAARALAQALADPIAGAAALDKQLNLLTADQVLHIKYLGQAGDTLGVQKVLYDAVTERIKGLAEKGLTPLGKATNELGNAWTGLMKSMADTGPINTVNTVLQNAATSLAKVIQAAQNPIAINMAIGAATHGLFSLPFGTPTAPAAAAASNLSAGAALAMDAELKQLDDQVKAALKTGDAYQSATDKMKGMQLAAIELESAMKGLERNGQAGSEVYKQLAHDLQNLTAQYGELSSQAPLVKARAEIQFVAQKEALDRGRLYLELNLKQNLTSYQSYYDALTVYQQQQIDKEIELTRKKLAVARAQLGLPGSPNQQAERQGAVETLQGQITTLGVGRQDVSATNLSALGGAQQQLASQINAMQAQILEAQGKVVEATMLRFSEQSVPLLKLLKQESLDDGQQIMTNLFNVTIARARMTEIEQANAASLAQMNEAERRVNIEQEAGLLTKYQAQQKINGLHRDEAAFLTASLPAMQTMSDSIKDPKILAQLDAIKTKVLELQKVADKTNWTFQYGAKSALDEYVTNTASAFRSGQEAMSGSLKSIEDDLTQTFKTGKLTAKSFADFAITELARIQARAVIKIGIEAANNAAGGGGVLGDLLKGLGFNGSNTPALGGGGGEELLGGFTGSDFPGGILPFAGGGVMTNKGPVPLRRYSGGGVANSPQFAEYGEGSVPEAYVPLPDGRRIPVAMQGGGSSTINAPLNVTINAPNAAPGVAQQLSAMIDQKFPGLLYQHRRSIEGLMFAQKREKGRR